MSKQQSKQTFNSGNTQLSSTRNQGAEQNSQLQGILGGYQQNAAGMLPGIQSGYQGISAPGGGYNAAALDQMNSTYTDLAQGGISPQQMASLTGQAAQTGQSAYQTAGDQLSRQISATGGYGFSGAAESQLARQGSAAASNATNNMLASLVGQQSANKATGASGLNQVQQGITGNQLASL